MTCLWLKSHKRAPVCLPKTGAVIAAISRGKSPHIVPVLPARRHLDTECISRLTLFWTPQGDARKKTLKTQAETVSGPTMTTTKLPQLSQERGLFEVILGTF